MQAAVLGEKGVEVRDLPKPVPKPNEVLIRVRASSLNRATSTVPSAASARGLAWSVPAKSRWSAATCKASNPATG
jgi:hypothetical protein